MPVLLHVPEEDAEECMLQDVIETLKIRYTKVKENFVFCLPSLNDSIVKDLDARGYTLYKETCKEVYNEAACKEDTDLIYTVEFKYFI